MSIFRYLGLGAAKSNHCAFAIGRTIYKDLRGVIEDVLVKVDKLIFSTNFIILDMEEDHAISIILRRPFLITNQALIDMQEEQLILRVQDE